MRLAIRPVDLVDDDDRLKPDRQRLHQHELRLRHRPFGRVDKQDRAVDHVQDALHLAAEIGMAGRVDDVDTRALPKERGHLGEDGDAALLLERVGIHGALGHLLAGTEGAGGAEKHVNQRRLAMIDMRDDGDVAKGRWHENLPDLEVGGGDSRFSKLKIGMAAPAFIPPPAWAFGRRRPC